jgi:hypothetical protein
VPNILISHATEDEEDLRDDIEDDPVFEGEDFGEDEEESMNFVDQAQVDAIKKDI